MKYVIVRETAEGVEFFNTLKMEWNNFSPIWRMDQIVFTENCDEVIAMLELIKDPNAKIGIINVTVAIGNRALEI